MFCHRVRQGKRLVHIGMVSFAVMLCSSGTALAANGLKFGLSNSFGSSTSKFSTSPIHLNVIPVGDTPKADVSRVKLVIKQYGIVLSDERNVSMGASQPINIYVAANVPDYREGLRRIGVSVKEASSLSSDTAGFTMGNSVVVPLFQNTSTDDLANTLGHELTHAIFNVNVGPLPSWINEGLAVSDGMYAQERVDGPVVYAAYARQMAETVLAAVSNHQLIPLAVNEAAVYNASYDVELQDWMSVQYLIERFGFKSVLSYFGRLKLGETDAAAFVHTFGITFSDFNQQFTDLLKRAAVGPDTGVDLTLSISASFHGNIRILQHGATAWQGFNAKAGLTSFEVTPAGNLKGVARLVAIPDAGGSDAQTMYVDLKPSGTMSYSGKKVSSCGFAINYNDGLYGYGNTWITTTDGNTIYLSSPSLFHVQLMKVKESPIDGNPILPWLSAVSNRGAGS